MNGGLRRLVILLRHGHRLPKMTPSGIRINPDLSYLDTPELQRFSPAGNAGDVAFLTQEGFSQAHDSGKELRSRYRAFMDAVSNGSRVYLRSTDYQRTFYSLQALYHGLFGSFPTQKIVQKPRDEDELYSNAKRPLNKQHLEWALRAAASDEDVRRYNRMLGTEGWSLDDIDDYLQQQRGGKTDVERELYAQSHGPWRAHWDMFYHGFCDEEHRKAVARPLFGHIAGLVADQLQNDAYEVSLFSGHDSTLCAVLACLETDGPVAVHPAYADYLVFEVRDDSVSLYARLDGVQGYIAFKDGRHELPLAEVVKGLERYRMTKQDADAVAFDEAGEWTRYTAVRSPKE